MRPPCLTVVSILDVIFSTLSEGECAHPELGESKVAQDVLRPRSNGQPESELNRPVHTGNVERKFERIAGDAEDVVKIDEVTSPDGEGPKVLGMDREASAELDRDRKVELTKNLTACEWNELVEKSWVTDGT